MFVDAIDKPREVVTETALRSQDSQLRLMDDNPAPVRESLYASYGKRFFDLLGAALLVAVFLPLILILSLCLLFQKGPVIFGHGRIGQHGRVFRCLKFRTMVPDADRRLEDLLSKDPEARRQWQNARKLDPDPRITATGGFLRRTSLDELPQLFNVLAGQMSLVGPRPVTEAELARYGGHAQSYLAMRPGLTGKWQVGGRNDVSYGTRVRMDAAYASEVSFLGDLAILLRTVGVVLGATGK